MATAQDLVNILNRSFSLSEMQNFCFDLGVDWENVPGNTKGGKAREMVQYFQRRSALERLEQRMRLTNPAAFEVDVRSGAPPSSSARFMQAAPTTVRLLQEIGELLLVADGAVYEVPQFLNELARTLVAIRRCYDEAVGGGLIGFIRLQRIPELEQSIDFALLSVRHTDLVALLAGRRRPELIPDTVRQTLREMQAMLVTALAVLTAAQQFAVTNMPVVDLQEAIVGLEGYRARIERVLDDLNQQR
jgi:hypothetical protein